MYVAHCPGTLPSPSKLTCLLSNPQKKDEDAAPLNDLDHLLVVAGNSDEENPYRKGSALQVRPLSCFGELSASSHRRDSRKG